ncbi:MAG: porin [Pseudomonadota bacterium]
MKTVWMTLALAGAFGMAHAQSSVSVSGLLDLSLGRDIGGDATRMRTGATNFLAFNGKEDLGDGLGAFFSLSMRLNPDNGTINPGFNAVPGAVFTQASYLGLGGKWGTVTLGRQFSVAAFAQVAVDPWWWENTSNAVMSGTGGIGNIWYNNALTYSYSAQGLGMSLQMAEKNDNPGWSGKALRNPRALLLTYDGGPWWLKFGHERPADGEARWSALAGSYDFGALALRALAGHGRDHLGNTVRSCIASALVPLGLGQLRASYGLMENDGVLRQAKLSAGYYYSLSRRTSIYSNLTHDTRAARRRSGYEGGLQHSF